LTRSFEQDSLFSLVESWTVGIRPDFFWEMGKTSMKISRICALFLLVAVGSAMAFADGINDPKIIIRGASASQFAMMSHCPPQGCTSVGLNFSFGVPKSGSGTLFFTNNSGVNWSSLTLIEKGVPAMDISCSSYLFPSCKTETLKNGAVAIILASSCGRGGIRNGQSFSIQLACVGASCWPGGLDFSAHANSTVPEPGTIAFMTTGLAAIVSRRKWWTKRLRA
jgi:hypothetical protein